MVIEASKTAHFKMAGVPEDEKLWWHSQFGKVRIPYAITTEAFDYYVDLVRSNRKSYPDASSSFYYSANLVYCGNLTMCDRTYKDVFVVTMTLRFSEYHGPTVAMHFSKFRMVVVKPNQKEMRWDVLAIYGDGKTSPVVA